MNCAYVRAKGLHFLHCKLYLLNAAPLRKSLTVETKAWKKLLCKYLKEKYKKKMIDTSIHTNKYIVQLSHPVANLEDVRKSMGALSKLRDAEIQTDMTLISIEV